jgi:general stress protein 26
MPNLRSKIQLADDEIADYLEKSKTVIMGTLNHDGWPHLVPMWYSMIDGLVHMHTYGSSQKVKNIQRDSRGSILVEDGEEYGKLRGVFARGHFEVRDDQEVTEEEAGDVIRNYVRKRQAIIFHPEKISSWYHAKL